VGGRRDDSGVAEFFGDPRRVGVEIRLGHPTITYMNISSASTPTIVYDGAVEPADLDEWEGRLRDVVARIDPLFYRSESKRHAEQYLRGLLSPLARKNGWTIAEYVGEAEPKALQRLLNLSPWDTHGLLVANREYAMEPGRPWRDPGCRSDWLREERR
jgi:hypothetical protein